MSLGAPEIIVIVVIVIVLFGVVKLAGDKRYLKRSGRNSVTGKDKTGEKEA